MGLRIIDKKSSPLTDQEVACITDIVAGHALRHADVEDVSDRETVDDIATKIRNVRSTMTTAARARDMMVRLESDIRQSQLDFTKTQHPVLPKTLLDLL